MKLPKLNWPLWAGFLLSLIAFLSYPFVFVWFPPTRDFPWANFVLFGLAIALLVMGVRRAFAAGRPHPKKAKIAGVVLTTLSVIALAVFVVSFFVIGRQLPASKGAPKVGQQAPDFTLSDTNDRPVSLASLLQPTSANAVTPAPRAPRGVLLIFYRGYW